MTDLRQALVDRARDEGKRGRHTLRWSPHLWGYRPTQEGEEGGASWRARLSPPARSSLLVASILLVVACGGSGSVEEFCDNAVEIKSGPVGDSLHGSVMVQIIELGNVTDQLPTSERRPMNDIIADTLQQAQSGSSWSNDDVIDAITDLCGDHDLPRRSMTP